MGLLTVGTPLTWEATKKLSDFVRQHGILQFLAQYRKLQHRPKDDLYWGDEVEYMILKFDDVDRKVYVSTRAQEILHGLLYKAETDESLPTSWSWEYCSYMVEGTPGKPYGGEMDHLGRVQANMEQRRRELEAELHPDEAVLSLAVFPRLGCGHFTWPLHRPDPMNGPTRSLYMPEKAFCQGHVRFITFSRNIFERRMKKIAINIPIYKDINTPSPFIEDFSGLGDNGESAEAALPDHIYMDCVSFGLGNCCLQVTLQASGLEEAQHLYDQLAPLCPIMLALSAASPIYKGYLSDIDNRWTVISQAADDRTDEEKGLQPLRSERFRIPKSRYDSLNSYLSHAGRRYNDIDLVYDKDLCDELRKGGVNELLSRHIAHLFIRDSILLLQEQLDLDDEQSTDHFENLQSTNWQTLRFKLPPPNSNMGWRVEFRPMDVQLTDFENAAFSTFIILMTRAILYHKLNLLIPISKVDENMKTSFKRDSVINDRFHFRKNVFTEPSPSGRSSTNSCDQETHCHGADEYMQMTMSEIFHGKEDFLGLIPLVNSYLDSIDLEVSTRCILARYLKLISLRASGQLYTCAHWIREFVTKHPEYRQDSVVSDSIAYDLLKRMTQISSSKAHEPNFIFDFSKQLSDISKGAVPKAED